ncbi:hypothetical protein HK104_007189 [Borealophlyctis nickersoniae]|nr:hypothetical protein HK104_007189 [Borealophlyctis nickersoniae]
MFCLSNSKNRQAQQAERQDRRTANGLERANVAAPYAHYSQLAKRRFDVYGRQEPDLLQYLDGVAEEVTHVIGASSAMDEGSIAFGFPNVAEDSTENDTKDVEPDKQRAAREDETLRAEEWEDNEEEQPSEIPSAEASMLAEKSVSIKGHKPPKDRPNFRNSSAWTRPLSEIYPTSIMHENDRPSTAASHQSHSGTVRLSDTTAEMVSQLELINRAKLAQSRDQPTDNNNRLQKQMTKRRPATAPVRFTPPQRATRYFRPVIMKYVDDPTLSPPIPGGVVKLMRDTPHRHTTIPELIKIVNPDYDPILPGKRRKKIGPPPPPLANVTGRNSLARPRSSRPSTGSTAKPSIIAPDDADVRRYQEKWVREAPELDAESFEIRRNSVVEWNSTLPSQRRPSTAGPLGAHRQISVSSARPSTAGPLGAHRQISVSSEEENAKARRPSTAHDFGRRGGDRESVGTALNGANSLKPGQQIPAGRPRSMSLAVNPAASAGRRGSLWGDEFTFADTPAKGKRGSIWGDDLHVPSTSDLSKRSASSHPRRATTAGMLPVGARKAQERSRVPPVDGGFIDKVVRNVLENKERAAKAEREGKTRGAFTVSTRGAGLGDAVEAQLKALSMSVWVA